MFVWDVLQDMTLIILMVCAVISVGVGIATEGWPKGMYDGLGIILCILLVVVVTAVSDYKQSLQFKDLDTEKKNIIIQVTLDRTRKKVSIYDLVVGDIVHLTMVLQLAGVDPNDPSVKDLLASMQNQPESEQKKDEDKNCHVLQLLANIMFRPFFLLSLRRQSQCIRSFLMYNGVTVCNRNHFPLSLTVIVNIFYKHYYMRKKTTWTYGSYTTYATNTLAAAPVLCGRGDKRTKKGKIFKGTYGNSRPKKDKKIQRIKDKVELPRSTPWPLPF